ncbi:MAG: hypothetical protein K2L24_02530, partial [Opitutales bacterium]|nr:hypothetical protein [Opitutales bacterium]
PTGDKVWTWTQIDANTSKFKADFQKFCDKLGEGNFKNAVTEINKLPWDDPFKGKERNDKINEILGKSGELKALLEKYVACKKEVHKLVMPPPPGAPEPTKKEGQQVAIEAAQENLKALAAHFKIDLGGGDDSGHHEPPPTGMTAETAKAEIANAENALKAAFGNDAAWENIANGTTIDWTTGDAAVQAAINLQPANLQPKLKAYYEYHKLMQEVLSATDADRKTKLEALQAKVDGWKATLSKKDAEDDGPIPDANPDWTEEQKKAYEHFKSRCVTETGDAGFHLLWMRQLKDAAAKVQDGTMRGILDVEAFNKTVQPFEETFKAFKNALRSAAKVSSEDFGANKNEKKWKELEAAWDASYKLCNEATKLFLLTEEQKGEIKGFKETFYGKGDDDKGTQAAWGESKAEIQKWNENPDHNFVIKDQKEIETKLIELDRWLGTTSANQVSNAFDYEKYKEKIKNHIQETKAALKGTRDDFEFAKMPPEVQDKVQPLKDLFKELGQSRQNIKLDAFTDDGIDEAFKGDFNANKGALEKALKTYDEMFQGIHSDWKKILDGDPTSITDDVLNGIQTRLNDAKTQLEDDKEGSLKDLMKKAQDAMEQAKKDTERAAENKKKMENFKKLGETLQSAIRSAAKVQHPTAFTDALDALDQYSKLFEKVRESTGKSVDTLFEEEWFTGGAAAIVATLQKVQEAVKNAVPIPQQGSSYSSGNPSLYQTYSGPTPRRNRRQSPSSRNEAYHSSSSDSKSGALSQREREREARRRAVYRRGGRVRN